jgi:hypothetical protein
VVFRHDRLPELDPSWDATLTFCRVGTRRLPWWRFQRANRDRWRPDRRPRIP